MIPCLATDVTKGQLPSRPDHEDAAELPGVPLHQALSGAATESAKRVQRHARRQHLDATSAQPRRPVRSELGVDEERTVELKILPEGGGKGRRPAAHDDQLGSPSPNLVDPVAQLRDLFAAEDSTEVAQKGQNDRPALPQRPEPNTPTLPVGKFQRRQLRRGSHRHASSTTTGA
jgi:hypothetical protein